jgi:hypothetical protein
MAPGQPVQNGWSTWAQPSFAADSSAQWYSGYGGANNAIFTGASFSNPVASAASAMQSAYTMTNGAGEAGSMIINAGGGAPFVRSALCPTYNGGFSLQYAFLLSAAPAAFNGIGDGLSVSFVDASAVNGPQQVAWTLDVAGVLVPVAAATTLTVDTHDDACGATPATPCTGTWTQYDNQHVKGAGSGYRLMNGASLLDYNLMFGGRYTSVNGGTSLAGVATTGQVAQAQVDFYNGKLSWYINGKTVFETVDAAMPDTFYLAFAAVTTSGAIETATLVIAPATPLTLFCPGPPPSPPPPPPPPPPPVPPTPPATAIKGCKPGDVALVSDYGKEQKLCLHLQGQLVGGQWIIPPGLKHPVITEQCANTQNQLLDNQAWRWSFPSLTHVASGLNLAVVLPPTGVADGTEVTVAAPNAQDTTQAWSWEQFSMIQPRVAPGFSLTDHVVSEAAPIGGPVHLWQLHASLPMGGANAAWHYLCVSPPQ